MPTNQVHPTRFRDAAAYGFKVFPVKSSDKVPGVPSWTVYKEQPATPEQLNAWDGTDHNVGIICGEPSNIIVLDADSIEAQRVVETLGLPITPTVKTGRGTHYFFRKPAQAVPNAVKIGGHKLDVRGDGGYVVGAGSVHANGNVYEWVVSPEEVTFAEFPLQVLDMMKQAKPSAVATSNRTTNPKVTTNRFANILDHSMKEALETLRGAEEGTRNDTLFKAGVKLANNVAGADADWLSFADQLRDAALKIGLTPSEVDATLNSCWKNGSTEPTQWMQTARDWLYVAKLDMFYHEQSGELVKVTAFNSAHASEKVAKGPISAFLLAGPYVEVIHDLDYDPGCPDRIVERDGLLWLNTYRPADIVAKPGDPSPFIEFVQYLAPEPNDHGHLLKAMAWTVRFPGQKLRHALMMRSAIQGVGKSLFGSIWATQLGEHNVRTATTEEVQSQFQGYLKQTRLVVVEELNYGFGPTTYTRLKDMITSNKATINEKHVPVKQWPNYANFLFFTNLENPICIEDSDRRFWYLDSKAQRRTPDYYTGFVAWCSANAGVIRWYLESIDLSDFNPNAEPPMTLSKQALIFDSRTELVKELMIAIDDREGVFNRDLVTLADIETQLAPVMRTGKTRHQLRRALNAVGVEKLGEQRVGSGVSGHQSGGKVSLWAIRNVRFWLLAKPSERVAESYRAEGLLAAFDGMGMEISHIRELPAG